MSWFPFYILALVGLRWFATSREKTAITIILLVAVGSTVMAHTIMPAVQNSWNHELQGSPLILPVVVEVLTVIALVTWSPFNLTTFFQVILLLISWCVHIQCFADIQWDTNVVYDNYEKILAVVGLGQLLAFYDTWFAIGRSLKGWVNFWSNRSWRVPAASGSIAVLHNPHNPRR